jgi:hypothetical protein
LTAGEVTWRKHTASMQKMLFPIPLPSVKPPRNRKNDHRVKRNGNICVLYGE